MRSTYTFQSFNDLSVEFIASDVIKNGGEVSPRRLKTKEIPFASIQVKKGITEKTPLEIEKVNEIVTAMINEDSRYQHKKHLLCYSGVSNQVQKCFDLLNKDVSTRQAIIKFKKDSCITSIQFLSRGGRINAILNCRSTDVLKKLKVDLILGEALRNFFASQLNLKTGKIVLFTASLHVYSSDFSKVGGC